MFLLLGDIIGWLKYVARNENNEYPEKVVKEVRIICNTSLIE